MRFVRRGVHGRYKEAVQNTEQLNDRALVQYAAHSLRLRLQLFRTRTSIGAKVLFPMAATVLSSRLIRVFSSAVLVCGVVFADPTATILGRVTDPSGASVARAKVKVRNEATGIERSSVSTESGDFELSLLPVSGRYTLTVSSPGFETQQVSGIQLQVDQEARFDLQLKIGNVTETVTAQADAPVVNTDSGSVGQVIENRTILELPLNGRNFAQLTTLTASATVGPSNGSPTGFTTIAVSGGHAGKT